MLHTKIGQPTFIPKLAGPEKRDGRFGPYMPIATAIVPLLARNASGTFVDVLTLNYQITGNENKAGELVYSAAMDGGRFPSINLTAADKAAFRDHVETAFRMFDGYKRIVAAGLAEWHRIGTGQPVSEPVLAKAGKAPKAPKLVRAKRTPAAVNAPVSDSDREPV